MSRDRLRSILIRRRPESRPTSKSGAAESAPAPGEGGTPAALAGAEDPTTVFLRQLKEGKRHESYPTLDGIEAIPVAANPSRRKKHKDIIAAAALDPDDAAIRADVTRAMRTIRKTLGGLKDSSDERATQIRGALSEAGRDKLAYKTFAWNGSMDKLLEGWDEAWPIDTTAGLLLDISLALKGLARSARTPS